MNNPYGEFVNYYNEVTEEKIDYDECVNYLNSYSLERLGKNNGLTVEENKRLFNTIHTAEIIFLRMKGLMKKLKR
jgi:hypothetical protein